MLAWDGEAVRQGVDHAAYHLGGRADRTPTVGGPVLGRLRLVWPNGPSGYETERFSVGLPPDGVTASEMGRAWGVAAACASRGLGAVEVLRCP